MSMSHVSEEEKYQTKDITRTTVADLRTKHSGGTLEALKSIFFATRMIESSEEQKQTSMSQYLEHIRVNSADGSLT